MKIKLNSILVDDQAKAIRFYTEVLGFIKKNDIPMGEYRWMTVVSPEEPEGTELVLEPAAFPPAKIYQKALFDAGIPLTAILVDQVEKEYQRLATGGVSFSLKPTVTGNVKMAMLEDTCGNRIQLYEVIA